MKKPLQLLTDLLLLLGYLGVGLLYLVAWGAVLLPVFVLLNALLPGR